MPGPIACKRPRRRRETDRKWAVPGNCRRLARRVRRGSGHTVTVDGTPRERVPSGMATPAFFRPGAGASAAQVLADRGLAPASAVGRPPWQRAAAPELLVSWAVAAVFEKGVAIIPHLGSGYCGASAVDTSAWGKQGAAHRARHQAKGGHFGPKGAGSGGQPWEPGPRRARGRDERRERRARRPRSGPSKAWVRLANETPTRAAGDSCADFGVEGCDAAALASEGLVASGASRSARACHPARISGPNE